LIALIGMMGSGKSSVGRMLARRLDCLHMDLDKEIERTSGLSVDAIFTLHGEAYFRDLEEAALLRLVDTENQIVLSLGGGAVLSHRAMEALKARARAIVYLSAPVPQLLARLKQSPIKRPLLKDARDQRARLLELLSVRRPLYERYADLTVDTDRKLLADVAQEILEALESYSKRCR